MADTILRSKRVVVFLLMLLVRATQPSKTGIQNHPKGLLSARNLLKWMQNFEYSGSQALKGYP